MRLYLISYALSNVESALQFISFIEQTSIMRSALAVSSKPSLCILEFCALTAILHADLIPRCCRANFYWSLYALVGYLCCLINMDARPFE